MPASVKYDIIHRSSYQDSFTGGRLLTRGALVTGLELSIDDSDATVWKKACDVLPSLGTFIDTDIYPFTYLDGRRLVSINRETDKVYADLLYRSPGVEAQSGGSLVNFTLTRISQTSHIQTFSTADGSKNLFTWYKRGGSTDTSDDGPTGAVHRHFAAAKIVVTSVLRASAFVTGEVWAAHRPGIMAMRGTINSVTWGGDARGKWLFMGPTTRTLDHGVTYFIQLDFLEAYKDWFSIGAYFDRFGNHPKDCTTEAVLRAGALPAHGAAVHRNGITLASIYDEDNFTTEFGFDPSMG